MNHGSGSDLGPILYIIYINELPAVINDSNYTNQVHEVTENLFNDNCLECGSIPTYADDSTFVIATSTRNEAQDKITNNMRKIKDCMDTNSLSINLGKTEILELMVRQKRVRMAGAAPQLTVLKPDGTLKLIAAADSFRLLGVNLSRDVTWIHQMELGEKALLSSLRSVIGAIAHISPNLPVSSRQLIANGLVISRILCLIAMWGGIPQHLARKVQVLMNKCAR